MINPVLAALQPGPPVFHPLCFHLPPPHPCSGRSNLWLHICYHYLFIFQFPPPLSAMPTNEIDNFPSHFFDLSSHEFHPFQNVEQQ